jgi:broad specificity phosphatase PhoE
MTTVHFVRHGTNDYVETGRLAGRMAGVSLNARGREQAIALAGDPVLRRASAILSSPLERARETVEPLATGLGLEVEPLDELIEIDFGEWTGKRYQELEGQASWRKFNLYRSGCEAFRGESMIDVQYRMIRGIDRIRQRFPDGEVVAATHCDPIRAVLCWCLGMPLDLLLRLEIEPASRSTVVFGEWGPLVKVVNYSPATTALPPGSN